MAGLSTPPHIHFERRDDESRPATNGISPWLLVWTILVAKIGTLAIIVWAARSAEAGALVTVTSLPWIVAGVALAAGPFLFRYRLRRVRARREELHRQEWMVPGAESQQQRPPAPARRH